MDKKYILSFGGGVNSSALLFYIIEKKLNLDEVIFSDTGVESEETYKTVKEMQKVCSSKNIKFTTVKSKYGNLYDYYFKNKCVMSMKFRDCTGKFKVAPIRQYIRKEYGKKQKFVMYIGIAWDEATRCKTSNVKYIEHSYPFVDDKINRKGNVEILNKYNFNASKSGCKGCMFNSKNNWIKMLKEEPKEFNKWKALELNGSRYPEITLSGYSLEKLEKNIRLQKSLIEFIDKEITCDSINGGCFL